jgi:hypothetical protein
MKENLKQWCDKYDAVREQLLECVDDLKKWPYDSVRLDRLGAEEPKYAELLHAVADDYPDVVQIWCGKVAGWDTTVTPGFQLSPKNVHRIKPGWTVPDDPREYVYLSGAAAGKATPAPREWFWGEARWLMALSSVRPALMFRIPDSIQGYMRAKAVRHLKVEGWKWCGFVFGEREPGEPRSLHPDVWMYADDDVVYADWAVWRKDGEA